MGNGIRLEAVPVRVMTFKSRDVTASKTIIGFKKFISKKGP